MPITFACKCGKNFKVGDDMAGKRAKCPQCQNTLTVPGPATASAGKPAAKPTVAPTKQAVAPAPTPPKPAAPAPVIRRTSGFHKAPLALKPTFGQMWKTAPMQPMISLLLLLLGLGACAGFAINLLPVGIAGVVLALAGIVGLATFGSGAKAKMAKAQFVPGMIVSLNPPLVALGLDLTSNPNSGPWDALWIVKQDCAGRLAGPPAMNAKVAMAVMLDAPAGANHTSPKGMMFIDQVNGDKEAINKLLADTPEEKWNALREAIDLIGPEFTVGIYTIVRHERSGDPVAVPEVKRLMQESLPNGPDQQRYHSGKTLVAPVLKPALDEYGSGVPAADVLGMVKVDNDPSGKRGFLITNDGLRFKLSDKLMSDMAWSDVHSALLVDGQLEILMTSTIRMTIPAKTFDKNAHRIEKFLHDVGQLP